MKAASRRMLRVSQRRGSAAAGKAAGAAGDRRSEVIAVSARREVLEVQ
jgi:hypothetical protein